MVTDSGNGALVDPKVERQIVSGRYSDATTKVSQYPTNPMERPAAAIAHRHEHELPYFVKKAGI